MKIVRSSELEFIPASHEDPRSPGVLKKVLLRKDDLHPGTVQMINWAQLPIGKSFQAHYHEDMEEVFVMLTGEAIITVVQEEATLKAGDAVVIPASAIHTMTNSGDSPVEYLAIGISGDQNGKTVVV